jgi:hypothetical protein
MEEQIINKLTITSIVPAKDWNYLYACSNKGNLFIYAHKGPVEFFANHKAENASTFQDTKTKCTAIKYFNEISSNRIENIIKNSSEVDKPIKFGTCLVTYDLKENFIADIWINNNDRTVEFHLKDALDFKHILTPDITLPDLQEEQRLKEKEITFNNFKNNTNYKLVTLIQEQPLFFKKIFSLGSNFTENQLNELKNELDWDELSANSQMNWTNELIQTFSNYINWKIFILHNKYIWDEKNIDLFNEKIDWESFSKSTVINWNANVFEKYSDKLHWGNISKNESIPWTKEFINKHREKLNLTKVIENKGVLWNIDLIEYFMPELKSSQYLWNYISMNSGSFWTEEFIAKYQEQLNWEYLCTNHSLPWSFAFIAKYAKYNNWNLISKNEFLPWTEEYLEQNKDKLAFGWLSGNEGLPWSLNLVEKYMSKWNWDNLSSNSSVPWTEEFIEKNLTKFQNFNGTWGFWKNKKLPQNEEFWIKHKEILFPSNKGNGFMRVIDANNNGNIPLSLDLIFALKDNLDWDKDFYQNIIRTEKYKILLSEFSVELFKQISQTNHFLKNN